jgi:hypothetical protein
MATVTVLSPQGLSRLGCVTVFGVGVASFEILSGELVTGDDVGDDGDVGEEVGDEVGEGCEVAVGVGGELSVGGDMESID